jgi:hypothetical protein
VRDPHPGDPLLAAVSDQADHVAALDESHRWERLHPLADVALQEWAAGGERGKADFGLAQPLTRYVDSDAAQRVCSHRARLHQVLGEAGEQFVEQLPAVGMQCMYVTALRHPSAIGGVGRQDVPLDHCHLRVSIG